MNPLANQTHRVREYFHGPSGRLNYDRLVVYAEKQVLQKKFSAPFVSIQPPAHYVNEAINRCLPGFNGKVARNLKSSLPLEVLFKGIIKSVVSHELNPGEARKRNQGVFGLVSDGEGMRQLAADDFEQSTWSDARGDVEIRSNAIKIMDERPVIEAFIDFVRKDEIVHRMILLLIEEDIDEPAELVASRVGITVQEVYVARKRLQRLCGQFAQEGRN